MGSFVACFCPAENPHKNIARDKSPDSTNYNDFDADSHIRTEDEVADDPVENALLSQTKLNKSTEAKLQNTSKTTSHSLKPNDNKSNTQSTDTNPSTITSETCTVQTIETKTDEITEDESLSENDNDNQETKEEEEEYQDHEFELQPLQSNSLPVIAENQKKRISPFRIQIEQLPKFKHAHPWILDKNRETESPASTTPTLKAFSYDKSIIKSKRVTLTNTHNFLWMTSLLQGAVRAAKTESEITRSALDKVLNLLPVPFRDKIWEICNIDHDSFIVHEEFEEFVDAILVASGQYDIDMLLNDDDEMFEIRDMSNVFKEIVTINEIFMQKKCVSNTVSRTTPTLSTFGATQVIILLRNLEDKEEIRANDISIPLLTGFTKKAMRHSVKYCSRIFWKILTNIWWDEDDDEDMALPADLDEYKTKSKHTRKRSKVSGDVRKHLSNTSMDDLFPDLYRFKSFSETEEDDIENSSNYLHV